MKLWFLGGSLALLVAGAPLRADETAPKPRESKDSPTFQVPYKLTDSKHVLVRVKLNGKGPFNFILDTGAPAMIMSDTIAKKTGVELKNGWGVFPLELEGGVKVPEARGLAADMFQLRGMNAMGLAGVELHGVLGYNILARFRIEYDFTSDKLAWTPLKFEPPKMIGLGRKAEGQGGLEFMGDLMKFLAPLMGIKPNFEVKPRGFAGLEVEVRNEKLFVKSVLEGGPAAAAGLKAGDQIVTANKKPVDTAEDLHRAARKLSTGDKLTFQVKRGEQTETVTVELGRGL
jgi:serine protease DegQ